MKQRAVVYAALMYFLILGFIYTSVTELCMKARVREEEVQIKPNIVLGGIPETTPFTLRQLKNMNPVMVGYVQKCEGEGCVSQHYVASGTERGAWTPSREEPREHTYVCTDCATSPMQQGTYIAEVHIRFVTKEKR